MEKENTNEMKEGFVGKEQLARRYGYASVRGFMRQLDRCHVLERLRRETGYSRSQKLFSPAQLSIIYEVFGS